MAARLTVASTKTGKPSSPRPAANIDYSVEGVEKVISKFEKAVAKQVEKAPEDVATAEREFLKPGFTAAETSLMSVSEEMRDICALAVLGTTPADREKLDDIFGKGCDCERFNRLRDARDKVTLSQMTANDVRWSQMSAKIATIEEILKGRGSFKGFTPAPRALSYPPVAQCFEIGEKVSIKPNADAVPLTYAIEPALPEGMLFDTSTGEIGGSPCAECPSTTYVITGSNSGGKVNAEVSFEVKKPAPKALQYQTVEALYDVGTEVNLEPSVDNEVLEYSVHPDLPKGLTLNPSTGSIIGTTATACDDQAYTVTAKNASGSATTTFSIKVTEPQPTSLRYPGFREKLPVNNAIELAAEVEGGACTTWKVEPALPAGMSLDLSNGRISGTPTELVAAATYKITASNARGQASFEFSLAVEEDLISRIVKCTNTADLLAIDAGRGGDTWMVWMVHRVYLNDETLDSLDFSGQEMPLPHIQAKVAPKLMKALAESNTNLKTLKVPSTGMIKETGMELATALGRNKTLTLVNIESNLLDADAIKACANSLAENKETSLAEWNFAHQKAAPAFGAATDQVLVQMMKDNNTLVKCSYVVADIGGRDSIARYQIRNADRARRLAKGDAAEEDVVKEVRDFRTFTLSSPPTTSAREVFPDEVDEVARAFCAEKQTLPTNEQLQSYAKGKGQPIAFAKVAPARKSFGKKLINALVETEVSIEDVRGESTSGVLKAWTSPTDNVWTFNLKEAGGKLVQYKGNKEPSLKMTGAFLSWLQP